ncbi:hypothetical protein [Idiomarina sp. UBA4206]|uniref:hypothetical protein n=1 Tax=Gammaproteobacteria TaxID=1236 RepID=UPI002579E9E6|nr:hypothetical protein [Idiomarina sp. UBA4206]|tara:strand:- start:39 stop:377 length:339 start_codon:yes stop_codon:yes gene_type:complete
MSKEAVKLTLQVVMPDNPEHKLLWQQLAKIRINKGLPDPTVALNTESDHECWMYMYTTDERHRFLWFTWTRYVHVFRHRCHPATKCEERAAIPVRRGFDFSSLVTTWTGGGI